MIIKTKKKMTSEQVGSLLMLKASVSVLEGNLTIDGEWPEGYEELGSLCDALKEEIRITLDTYWWWG